MTLILLSCSERAAIIASDTRLSWNGKLEDENSAKAGCVTFYDGRLIYAYTGLARWSSFITRQWLLNVLAEKVGPWVAANDALLILKNKATEDFANLPALKGIPRREKLLTVAFAGYVGKQPVGAVLSNFENFAVGAEGVRYPEAQDQFFRSCWPGAPGGAGWWCSYFGNTKVISEADIVEFEGLVATNKPLKAIKGKMESIIVRASRDGKAQGAIGANVFNSATQPRALSIRELHIGNGGGQNLTVGSIQRSDESGRTRCRDSRAQDRCSPSTPAPSNKAGQTVTLAVSSPCRGAGFKKAWTLRFAQTPESGPRLNPIVELPVIPH